MFRSQVLDFAGCPKTNAHMPWNDGQLCKKHQNQKKHKKNTRILQGKKIISSIENPRGEKIDWEQKKLVNTERIALKMCYVQ